MQKQKLIFYAFSLLFLSIAACSPSKSLPTSISTNLPVHTATSEITPVPPITPTSISTVDPELSATVLPEKSDGQTITYKIGAVLDYSAKSVGVDQVIAITNFPQSQPNIELVVETNRYDNGFQLGELRINQQAVTEFTLENHHLKFSAPENRGGSDPIIIQIKYTLNLPRIPPPSEMYKPQPYGFTDRQLNLVDWYPYVPPVDENSNWIIHPTAILGESLVYPSADFSINLTINGNSAPLVVASSGTAERTENTYYFSNPAARSFAISISPEYVVTEGMANGVSIKAYAFRDSEMQNKVVLQHALEAVDLFSELYGPLPHKTISIIQADFLDGMEFDGLYFVSKGFYNLYDGTVKGYLSLITVHEMAHQWWFSVVGNDQATDPWLDEGLSTFAELQYLERYYPELTDWWWGYRVNFYKPEGFINYSIYDYGSYLAYRNAVYLQSAKFLFELRETIGHAPFDSAIKKYYKENYLQISNSTRFFNAFNNLSGYPFSEITEKFFHP